MTEKTSNETSKRLGLDMLGLLERSLMGAEGQLGGIAPFLSVGLRLSCTQRFNREDLNRRQSVAEHTFGVVMIAWVGALWYFENHRLSSGAKEYLKTGKGVHDDHMHNLHAMLGQVTSTALLHDFIEGLTGDLDYRVKNLNGRSKAGWEEIEAEALEKFMLTQRSGSLLRLCLEDLLNPEDAPAWMASLVKIADYLEFLHFCLREVSLGNRNAETWFITGHKIVREGLEANNGLWKGSPLSELNFLFFRIYRDLTGK